MSKPKKKYNVGIVILNFNNSEITKLTLEVLFKVKCENKFRVLVVDNFSDHDDYEELKSYINNLHFKKSTLSLVRNKKNLGYSGGNNIGITYFLNNKDIDYLCLLNSDVIVTDYWLDRLIKTGSKFIGPVTNAVGNEQTINPGFTAIRNISAYGEINAFAQKWYSIRKNWVVDTDDLHFFTVLIHRTVFEKIGFLDEQFYPGSFEDVDFCLRAKKNNIILKIHRGVFVYHYGSASFEKLNINNRLEISNQNLKKLEDKWGINWISDDPKLLLPLIQDVSFILDEEQKKLYSDSLQRHYRAVQNLLDRLVTENNYLKLENFKIHVDKVGLVIRLIRNFKKIIKSIFYIFKGTYFQILKRLIKRIITGKGMVVFAEYFSEELLKDGYYVRVKMIDNLMSDYLRLYISPDIKCTSLKYKEHHPLAFSILYNPQSRIQKMYISILILMARKIYCQSVLKFNDWEKNLLFRLRLVSIYWDVHGVVPEEFVYHDDFINAQKYGDIENILAIFSKKIICVTKKMSDHLINKYNIDPKKIIVLPNAITKNKTKNEEKCYNIKSPIITYAGGIMKWQMIDKMNESIYHMKKSAKFIICVPNVHDFWKLWRYNSKPRNLVVQTKSREELYKEVYSVSNYGFVLREDNVLNRVSCPTKLVEYLENDIIPIVDCINIGDFIELGYNYLTLADFLSGNFLNKKQYESAIQNNRKVIEQYKSSYEKGKIDMRYLLKN